MLEEVGESGLARSLVSRTDAIPEVHGHDGDGPIGRENDLEPIVQAMTLDRDVKTHGLS
jgi:hypothetical protein